MAMIDDDERAVADLWDRFDGTDDFVGEMMAVLARTDLPPSVRAFELGGAFDATDRTGDAVDEYRKALRAGLDGARRRRAVIQLASSLRSLGDVDEAIALLTAESGGESDDLDQAVDAFLSLSLATAGREREAVAVALTALASYLPSYGRSLTAYARQL